MTTKIWFIAGLLTLTSSSLVSCSDKKQDETETVNRAGAIETSVSVQHVDSARDVVLTTHKVWVKFAEYKTFVHADTVPTLGMIDTNAENSNGDTQKVTVPKDYEIFITVK